MSETAGEAPRPCLVEGCNSTHSKRTKGYCPNHYSKFRKYGDPLAFKFQRGAAKRFLEEVAFNYEGDECLIWPYATHSGYGVIAVKTGDVQSVHSIVCLHEHGPRPEGQIVRHLCGKGSSGCCAKRHLVWGTYSENNADMKVHGTSRSILTDVEIDEAVALKKSGLSFEAIAEKFGNIRPSAVRNSILTKVDSLEGMYTKRTASKILDDETCVEIYRRTRTESMVALAPEYGVGRSTIFRARDRGYAVLKERGDA